MYSIYCIALLPSLALLQFHPDYSKLMFSVCVDLCNKWETGQNDNGDNRIHFDCGSLLKVPLSWQTIDRADVLLTGLAGPSFEPSRKSSSRFKKMPQKEVKREFAPLA